MTSPAPDDDDLTPRVFRALFADYDLHTVDGTHIVVPAGGRCFTGRSLGSVARQISARPASAPADYGPRSAPPPPSMPPAAASIPPARQIALAASVLQNHPLWSLFWDKRYRLWRAADDDPDSALYAESPDLAEVIAYITART